MSIKVLYFDECFRGADAAHHDFRTNCTGKGAIYLGPGQASYSFRLGWNDVEANEQYRQAECLVVGPGSRQRVGTSKPGITTYQRYGMSAKFPHDARFTIRALD
jgi:hypothetical protein